MRSLVKKLKGENNRSITMDKTKQLMSAMDLANEYGMHERTLTSRLEREHYEGVYYQGRLCYYIDEKARHILEKPVIKRPRNKRHVYSQQELPMDMPKNDAPNAEVKTDEKVAEHHGPCLVTAMEEKCKNCKFFRLSLKDLNGIFGECRIHAPVMSLQKDGSYKQMCPMVSKDDSCGDFTP